MEFKFWCQKVLPLVYDDSLSYYELLCKVIDYVNNILESNKELTDNFIKLESKFNELKNYVDNYFNNLDVQANINKKLDEMAKDGTLTSLIEPLINGNLKTAINENDSSKVSLDNALMCLLNNYYINNYRTHVKSGLSSVDTEGNAFGVKNKDDVFMYPSLSSLGFTNGGNPLGAICVGASYIGKDITYGRDTGIFNVNGNVFKQMVCSDYLWAIMNGITYGNSKAGNKPRNMKSVYRAHGFKNERSLLAPVDKDAFITREQAWVYAACGRLEELDYKYYSNLMIGDIIFLANLNEDAVAKNNYLGIGHCSLVINVDYNNHIVYVMECGSGSGYVQRLNYASNTVTDSKTPTINELNIDDTLADKNIKIYVGRPSWNNVMPREIYSKHVSGTVDINNTYTTAVQLKDETTPTLLIGDVFVLQLHGNFNTMNPNMSQQAESNIRMISNYSDDTPYKLISRQYYSGNKNVVTNDIYMIGVLQKASNLTSIPLQMRSSIPTDITYAGELKVYRI